MKKLFRQIQFLANIATIVIAILLSIVVVRTYIFPVAQPENPSVSSRIEKIPVDAPSAPKIKPNNINPIGQIVPLQGIDWKENKKTLIMFISTTCRFCTESGSFYKRLVKENSNKNLKLMAVLPQTVDEGREYLDKLEVNIDEIYNARLSSIGVASTPTLLLVDEQGKVMEMWKGKLSKVEENQLIQKLLG